MTWSRAGLAMLALAVLLPEARAQDDLGGEPATPGSQAVGETEVVITGASQQAFPRIAVQFEVKKPDGTYLLDARRENFRVTEEGKDVKVLEFQAPQTREAVPTTVVLVVDHSGSMAQENRIGGLREAVASFLEKLPEGSRIAVVGFSSEVETLSPFTTDRKQVRRVINRLEPVGATRFYDAVIEALDMLGDEQGRRAILALTDGQDTASQMGNLEMAIAAAKRVGMPVYTLGLGSEREIAGDDLRHLAEATRAQYYRARDADQLKAIYESLATRLGASYSLVYESDRQLPDGTLRPVQIAHAASKRAAETAVFIPGMVVPAPGWSPLFLAMLAALVALAVLPSLAMRRG
ncbi:vWA domain-containing protein [Aquisphaera insulae]|uniref:vWA domain-containing protein n=1 Tax=Aquisphaera insulae TaxID=2712864 RepID=UPI0013EB8B4C|nr:VWA domain-containing protein [Aquisphaera insulae]